MSHYIGNQIQRGEFKKLDSIASSFDGSTTTFNLTFNNVSVQVGDTTALVVSLNGVVQEPGDAYTLGLGGSQIIFSSAPAAGNTCFITQLGGIGDTVTPTDGSVTITKLAADVVSDINDKLDSTTAASTYAPINNPNFTGEYVGIPTITTAQRDALTPQNGYLIYNTTIKLMQQYADGSWQSIAAPPILTALSYPGSQTAVNPDGGDTITLSGANFEVGANVKFGQSTYATSVTRNSSTSLTVTTPALSAGTYDVIVENPSGLSASLTNGITFNANPVFSTAAGNIGTITQDVAMSTITILATEDDSGTLSYSITTGALPTGLSFGSANGEITGTASGYTSDTTVNFTVTATDDENQTTERQFNLIVLVNFYNYEIENSIVASNALGSRLMQFLDTSVTNNTWTFSTWVKRSHISQPHYNYIFSVTDKQNTNMGGWQFGASTGDAGPDKGYVWDSNGGQQYSTEVLRDASSWYHTLLSCTNGSVDVYINGEQTATGKTFSSHMGAGQMFYLLGWKRADHTLEGYLAETHFVDGQAKVATDFGRFAQDIWIPKEYTGTYGSNGFYYDYNVNLLDTVSLSTGTAGAGGADPYVDPEWSKYGKDAIRLNNGIIYTNAGGNSDFDISSQGQFTVEMDANFHRWIGDNEGFFWWGQTSVPTPHGDVLWLSNSRNQDTAGLDIYFHYQGTNSGIDTGWSPSLDTWYHLAIVYDNRNVKFYIDGTLNNDFNISGSETITNNGYLGWGGGGNRNCNASFANMRFSNTARYTGNFTPPTTEFVRDSNTLLLIQNPDGSTESSHAQPFPQLHDINVRLQDQSGNNNHSYPVNMNSGDTSIDSPTNNFATLNPLDKGTSSVLAEGGLEFYGVSSVHRGVRSTFVPTRKAYAEMRVFHNETAFGLANSSANLDDATARAGKWVYYNNQLRDETTVLASITTLTSGDILQIAHDPSTGKSWIGKNNSWYDSSGGTTGNPATGTNPTFTISDEVYVYAHSYSANTTITNFGQDSSFAGNETAQNNSDGNGIGDFYYTPPSGFLALCTENLSKTGFGNILNVKPSDHFQTVTYTGTGTNGGDTLSVTGLDFQPDLVWIKNRSVAVNHYINDVIRGAGSGTHLHSNTTDSESSASGYASNGGLASIDSNGFTVYRGTDNTYQGTNLNGNEYVAWCWKANGTPVSNTDGSITSSVSANTDAGFSIVGFTGDGNASATVGHGLTQAPELVMVKSRSNGDDWQVKYVAGNYYLKLNATDAGNTGYPNYTTTSSVINLGYTWNNDSGVTHIAYAFHSVDGYSKVGTYTGNGSTDGPFINTGFKPAFVLVKRATSARNWQMLDNVRNPYNPVDAHIHPNLNNAEASANPAWYDSVSNGFKIRATWDEMNTSGETYIYMAFAEDPFKYNTAR